MLTICIDGGHRQTSASYCKKDKDNKKENQYIAYRLFVEGAQENVTLTQMSLTNEQVKKLSQMPDPTYEELQSLGVISYGKSLKPLEPGKGQKFIYFKRNPSLFDKEHPGSQLTTRQLMACFYYALVNNILKENAELGDERKDRNNVRLLVGCPTTGKWTDPEPLAQYARLIKRATGVNRVDIVPESRAAMFSSLNKELQVISAANGVIVFDLGSSTADCTYMWLGKRLVEMSWDLGASLIERIIVKDMISKAVHEHREKTGNLFIATASSQADMENTICNVKEAYFSKEYGEYEYVDDDITTKLYDSNRNVLKCRLNLTKGYMDKALDTPVEDEDAIIWDGIRFTGSWRKLLRQFFEAAKKEIAEAGYPVEQIVITGGASHMEFVRYLCAEVFDGVVKFDDITLEDNPEFTVSNGLAWVSLSDRNFNNYVNNAKNVVKSNNSASVYTLRDNIVKSLSDYLHPLINRYVKPWAESNQDLSIRDLTAPLERELKSQSTKNRINNIVNTEIVKWKANYSNITRDAVNDQLKKEYPDGIVNGLIPTKKIWEDLQETKIANAGSISTSALLKMLDINRIIRYIIMTPFAIVYAAVSWIPIVKHIGKLIFKLGGGIANLFTDDDLDKPRWGMTRKSVRNQLNETFESEEARRELFKSVYDSFDELNNKYDAELAKNLNQLFRIVMLYPDGFEERIMK